MKKIILKSVIWKEGKFYVAQCLNVDVSSFGKTRRDALKNLKEALDLYFENKKISFLPEVVSPSITTTPFLYA